jgi:hypothetical protein
MALISALSVAAVLLAIVHTFIGLALALVTRSASAAITARLGTRVCAVAIVIIALCTLIRHMALLFLAAIIMIPSGHRSPLCLMR